MPTTTRLRHRAGLALAGLALGATALLGTALGTGHADAKVDPGRYTWHLNNLGFPNSVPVTVHGDWLYPAGQPRMFIHSTPRGGWVEANGQVYLLTKRGNTYSGNSLYGPFTVGNSALTHR